VLDSLWVLNICGNVEIIVDSGPVVVLVAMTAEPLPSVVLDVDGVGTLNGVVVLFPVSTLFPLFFFPAVPPTAPPTVAPIIRIITTKIVILPLVECKNGVRDAYFSLGCCTDVSTSV